MGYFKVYPNMYIMLVGNPGIKKTTAMKLARRLVVEVGDRTIAPASITKEALTQYMAEKNSPCKHVFGNEAEGFHEFTHISIFANELVNLLNAGGNPIGMIDLLTDIWDSDKFEVKTKNKGNDFIEGPFINILGCMTPEVMQNLLYQRIISGGFSRRCLFVYANHNGDPVPIPSLTPQQEKAWELCVQRGKELLKFEGRFHWTPDAEQFWKDWYCTNFKATEKCDSLVLQGFHRSKPEYLLKVAMLIACSENDELLLTAGILKAALAFIDQVQPGIQTVFEGTGRNELSPIAGAIQRFIEASEEPVKLKRIYATFYQDADTDEINKILDHLAKVEKIVMKSVVFDKTAVVLVATSSVMEGFLRKLQMGSD